MDVRESDRKTGNGEGQPDGESGETGERLCGVRTGKAEKPEEGCAACGREKQINRKEAGRRTNGESGQRRPGGRRTAAEVDNLPAALKVFAQGYIMMRNWATILTI